VRLRRPNVGVVVAAVAIAVAVADFWKVLIGRIPLPMDVVESFPAWAGVPGRLTARHHGEMGDLVTQNYPFRAFTATTVRHGHLPLWQPHLLAGYPWVGALQWGVFSPSSLPYYVLSTPTAWALSYILRLSLAAVFMTLFCRRLGAATAPAIVAGLAFGGGGYVLAWSGWPIADIAVWVPAVLLGIDVLRERPNRRPIVLTALAVAAVILGGHPQTVFYAGLLAGAFAVHRAIGWGLEPARRSATRGRFLIATLSAAALGAGLSALQVLPGIEWLGRLHRNANLVYRDRHPIGAIAGLVSRDVSHQPNGAGIALPNGALYLGMLVVVGSALALLWRSRGDVAFFATVTIASGCVAFGVPPFFSIANHLPLVKAVPNGRMTFFMCVGLPVLASLGITAAMDRAGRRSGPAPRRAQWAAWALGVVGTTMLLVLLVRRSRGPVSSLASVLHGPAASICFAGLAALLLAPAVLRRLPRAVTACAIVLLAAVDLITFGNAAFPSVTRAEIFRRAPILDALRLRTADGGRVAVVDSALPPNIGMMYGFDSGDGYEEISADLGRFLSGLVAGGQQVSFTSAGLVAHPDRRLDMLAIRYIVTSDYNAGRDTLASQPSRFRQVAEADHTQVFENLHALPRAWLVPAAGAREVVGIDAAVAAVRAPSFDPASEVVVDGHLPTLDDRHPTALPPVITSEGNGTVRMKIRVDGAAVVVVGQQWFPGWTAQVDGRRAPVLRVDGVLQGVALGTGSHEIVLRYQPSSFRRGLAISIIALVAALILFWAPRRWRGASAAFPKIGPA
jgi:hypothetical protein